MGKKGTPHRKYSKEEKMRYVRLHLEDHISVRQIERDYGIGNALVSSWVKRYLQDGEDALEPHNGNPYAALHRSKSLSEVERLRLLVAKQEIEIHINPDYQKKAEEYKQDPDLSAQLDAEYFKAQAEKEARASKETKEITEGIHKMWRSLVNKD